ncbi:hypothetical protein PR048_010954 [Dryococelus australis]|uniref:Uncharacterized protein n=1 Tax=Dryococelus australis TaxID=614101 RepID=A0ABQ9HK80_9NEOP|nr:hypothetical protein PR048_010954 [Dryococelus australis]
MLEVPRFPHRKKLQLFKQIVNPLILPTNIQKVQITQNKFLRAISDAGWYNSYETIHRLLEMDYIKDVIISRNKHLYENFNDHDNTFINEIPKYDPLHARK